MAVHALRSEQCRKNYELDFPCQQFLLCKRTKINIELQQTVPFAFTNEN